MTLILANAERCLASARLRNDDSGKLDVKWSDVAHRLRKKYQKNRKNTDGRIHFRRGDNCFLTKAMFTFGCRRKGEFESHLVETTDAPVLLYVRKSNDDDDDDRPGWKTTTTTRPPSVFREKSLKPHEQNVYDPLVLEPNAVYRIPFRTRYVLLTVQKTLFGLHRMNDCDAANVGCESLPSKTALLRSKSKRSSFSSFSSLTDATMSAAAATDDAVAAASSSSSSSSFPTTACDSSFSSYYSAAASTEYPILYMVSPHEYYIPDDVQSGTIYVVPPAITAAATTVVYPPPQDEPLDLSVPKKTVDQDFFLDFYSLI